MAISAKCTQKKIDSLKCIQLRLRKGDAESIPLTVLKCTQSYKKKSEVHSSVTFLSKVHLSDMPLSKVHPSDIYLSEVHLSDVLLSKVHLSVMLFSEVHLSDHSPPPD